MKFIVSIFREPVLVRKFIKILITKGLREAVLKIKRKYQAVSQCELQRILHGDAPGKVWVKPNELISELDVSVIIPTYNRSDILLKVLDSWRNVDKETTYAYEIIFSDDGSTDDTLNILKSVTDLPIRVLENEHGGAAKARNAAIHKARGEKLIIIGDDIFPNQQIINQHMELLKELPVTAAVLGKVDWHPEIELNYLMNHITEVGNEQFGFNRFKDNADTDFRHFYTCNISLDREFLLSERVIFDERFYKVNFEDIELGYRLAKKGMKVRYASSAFGYHYHPYKADKFIIRQEVAGEMATVFCDLHPEMNYLLNTDLINNKYLEIINESLCAIEHDIRVELVLLCSIVDEVVSKDKGGLEGLKRLLSKAYGFLFLVSFEVGVIKKLSNASKLDVYTYVMHRAIQEDVFSTIEKLNLAAKLVSGIEVLGDVDKLTSSLIDAEKYNLSKKKLNSNGIKLNVICPEQATFDELFLRYSYFDCVTISHLDDDCSVDRIGDGSKDYFYMPTSSQDALSNHELLNSLLYLSFNDEDFLVVSHLPGDEVNELPGAVSTNQLIVKSKYTLESITSGGNEKFGSRLFLLPIEERGHHYVNSVKCDYRDLITNPGEHTLLQNPTKSACRHLFGKKYNKSKKVVFVWPVFLAVGGVERNTIEIMRQLQSKYDFIVVSMEKLTQQQGTLHDQFISVSEAVIDMSQLFRHERYLDVLTCLGEYYDPDLIWICNGSPWLNDHAGVLQRLFDKTPFVSQQAYDTKEGWIARHGEYDIKSFDHHIAINSRIRDVFIDKYHIEKERVSLIYSAVKPMQNISYYLDNRYKFASKYSIDMSKRTFVWVGRLTEQKNPFLFLEFASLLSAKYNYDFILVGDGELRGELRAYIDEMKPKCVRTIDYVDELPELYSIVDALIITSKYEGLPIAMLEAMSVGVPVFSSDVGDIKLVLDKYNTGKVFSPDISAAAMMDVFLPWLADIDSIRDVAMDECVRVRDEFDAKTISLRYESLWDDLIAEGSDAHVG